MPHLRAILSAGVCSVVLSGCLPAAAGLALSAVSMVTGGGSNGGDGFRNPIDRQSTGRQVREALSRLNDKVDPACQAMLDEHMKAYGTLAAGAGGKPGATKSAPSEQSAADSSSDSSDAKNQKPPLNLLAKVSLPADEAASAADAAISADMASGTAPVDTRTESAAPQPVKASLEPDAAVGPGQCEHRWVCLPSTPKPTIMLMCPGKGGKKHDATTADANALAAPDDTAAEKPAKSEQETAALGDGKSEASAPPAAGTAAPAAPAADASAAPEAAPAQETIRSGGVADWNWSYDPSKQL